MASGAVGRFREKIVLATAFGWRDGDAKSGRLDSRLEPVRPVAEQALKRQQTKRIGLFCQHRVGSLLPIFFVNASGE